MSEGVYRQWQIAGVIIDIIAMATLKKGWAGPEKFFNVTIVGYFSMLRDR